ncbi:hypothetical protein ACE3NQ_16270 [Paenibacillus terreus]|uniref:Uncharacterized protein n=1 Tax=Paenibacillus terreus TaxID=1387834 RepID=A0ABV5B9V8_9BACL
MLKSDVKTYTYKVGKNNYIVINIFQSATAHADNGNVLASNAVNLKIYKNAKGKR